MPMALELEDGPLVVKGLHAGLGVVGGPLVVPGPRFALGLLLTGQLQEKWRLLAGLGVGGFLKNENQFTSKLIQLIPHNTLQSIW